MEFQEAPGTHSRVWIFPDERPIRSAVAGSHRSGLGVPNRHVSGTSGPAESLLLSYGGQIVRRHPKFLLVQNTVAMERDNLALGSESELVSTDEPRAKAWFCWFSPPDLTTMKIAGAGLSAVSLMLLSNE